MSISLLISYHDPRREDRLVPIASDDTFQRFWRPTCRALGLRWLARFQSGWTLAPLDLPPILAELHALRHHLPYSDLPPEALHHLLARISVLRRELREIEQLADATAYIGSVLNARGGVEHARWPIPIALETIQPYPKIASMPTASDDPLPGSAASTESSPGPISDWLFHRSNPLFPQISPEDL